MILQRKLNWILIIRLAWRQLLYFFLLSSLVYIGYESFHIQSLGIHFVPVGEIGTALAIFLAFRNNSAYDRWWEARKIWGMLVNLSRAFASQATTFIGQVYPEGEEKGEITRFQKELVYRHIAFINALRLHLRNQESYEACSPFLGEAEYQQLRAGNNKPNLLLQIQREKLSEACTKGWLDVYRQVEMDRTLTEFNHVQGKSERIKNTPFPRLYDFFTRSLIFLYATLLPFGLVGELGVFTIPVATGIPFIFHILDQVGSHMEDPFENRPNDIPLSALCRTIEINLKEQLGETNLPSPLGPVNGILH